MVDKGCRRGVWAFKDLPEVFLKSKTALNIYEVREKPTS